MTQFITTLQVDFTTESNPQSIQLTFQGMRRVESANAYSEYVLVTVSGRKSEQDNFNWLRRAARFVKGVSNVSIVRPNKIIGRPRRTS